MTKITCCKCKKDFDVMVRIDGKKRYLYKRKYCLDCSPFGKNNTRTLCNPMLDKIPKHQKCKKCKEKKHKDEFFIRRYKPIGSDKLREALTSYCKTCYSSNLYEFQMKKGVERKIKLVNLSGGGCTRCGYSGNLAALDFHHNNPDNKMFKLDTRSLGNRTWKKSLSEFYKCTLLCSNCHREEHCASYKMTTVDGKVKLLTEKK